MTEEKQEYVTREEYEKLKKRLEEVEVKCGTMSVTTAIAESTKEEAETEQETEISQEET